MKLAKRYAAIVVCDKFNEDKHPFNGKTYSIGSYFDTEAQVIEDLEDMDNDTLMYHQNCGIIIIQPHYIIAPN